MLRRRGFYIAGLLPRLSDASTALAGRFLVLRLTHSFFGSEDPTLTDQLLAELPGILLWAIDGWKRLRQRGRFVQPKSVEDAICDMEDLASPVSQFVRERCDLDQDAEVILDDLYACFKSWCEAQGVRSIPIKNHFSRDLTAAFPNLRRSRKRDELGNQHLSQDGADNRTKWICGIKLK